MFRIAFYIYMLRPGFRWDCDSWHVTRMIKNKYKIVRMPQGSIKKKTTGREFLQSKTLGKSQRNERQALTKPT